MRIYACAARVFVEANGVTAGEEALVLMDGSCFQPIEPFLALVKSYKEKRNITIEADSASLRLFSSVRGVLGYTRSAWPPDNFRVVTLDDTWISQAEAYPHETRERSGEPYSN